MDKLAASISETCEALSLGRTKIFSLLNEGKLRKTKVGRRTLVHMDSIRDLVKEASE